MAGSDAEEKKAKDELDLVRQALDYTPNEVLRDLADEDDVDLLESIDARLDRTVVERIEIEESTPSLGESPREDESDEGAADEETVEPLPVALQQDDEDSAEDEDAQPSETEVEDAQEDAALDEDLVQEDEGTPDEDLKDAGDEDAQASEPEAEDAQEDEETPDEDESVLAPASEVPPSEIVVQEVPDDAEEDEDEPAVEVVLAETDDQREPTPDTVEIVVAEESDDDEPEPAAGAELEPASEEDAHEMVDADDAEDEGPSDPEGEVAREALARAARRSDETPAWPSEEDDGRGPRTETSPYDRLNAFTVVAPPTGSIQGAWNVEAPAAEDQAGLDPELEDDVAPWAEEDDDLDLDDLDEEFEDEAADEDALDVFDDEEPLEEQDADEPEDDELLAEAEPEQDDEAWEEEDEEFWENLLDEESKAEADAAQAETAQTETDEDEVEDWFEDDDWLEEDEASDESPAETETDEQVTEDEFEDLWDDFDEEPEPEPADEGTTEAEPPEPRESAQDAEALTFETDEPEPADAGDEEEEELLFEEVEFSLADDDAEDEPAGGDETVGAASFQPGATAGEDEPDEDAEETSPAGEEDAWDASPETEPAEPRDDTGQTVEEDLWDAGEEQVNEPEVEAETTAEADWPDQQPSTGDVEDTPPASGGNAAGDGYTHGPYTLYHKTVETSEGEARDLYFFARNPPEDASPADLPDGYEVGVNERTGVPFVREDT